MKRGFAGSCPSPGGIAFILKSFCEAAAFKWLFRRFLPGAFRVELAGRENAPKRRNV